MVVVNSILLICRGTMDGPRYILGSKIASGGMAEIHLGKQISKDGFERICAVKRILPHLSSNRDFIEMFRDEAHICKKLQHTNIVRIEGFEDIDGSFAIIMEFVDGSDLRSILSACERSKTRLSVPMALFIAAEAARGLHYAHTKRDDLSQASLSIVHRDISPQNILVSYEGEVKVTDFGIAKAKNKNTETQTGTVKGKYSYMSPEQIMAQKVDRRSDIFSLGIVLWETLAMRKLFQAGNDVTTIGRVRNCKITTSLAKENKNVSPELEKLVLKCLTKDPKERYQHADDMEKALRKFLYANYPDFSAGALGKFIKERLASKRRQTRKNLKAMLSEAAPAQEPELDVATESPKLVILSDKKKEKKTPPKKSLPPVSDGNTVLKLEKPLPTALPVPDASKRKKEAVFSQPLAGKASRSLGNVAPLMKDLSESVKDSRREKAPLAVYGIRKRKRKKKASNSTLNALVAVSIAFIISIAIFIVKNKPPLRISSSSYLMLKLDTTPSRVKINVGGKPYKNGVYLQTPLTIRSGVGKHTVKIFRHGYRSRKFEYRGKKGQTIEKTLVLDPIAKMSPVRIISENKRKKYIIDVNNGFFKGESPALIPDLVYNKRHSVRITPKGGGRMRQFTCSFVPTSRSSSNPHLLIIKGRRCSNRSR